MFGRPAELRIEFRVVNRSGREVSYQIGDRTFPLGPRFIRTHQRCRPNSQIVLQISDESDKPIAIENGETLVVAEENGELRTAVQE
jgi:hypothetical protein